MHVNHIAIRIRLLKKLQRHLWWLEFNYSLAHPKMAAHVSCHRRIAPSMICSKWSILKGPKSMGFLSNGALWELFQPVTKGTCSSWNFRIQNVVQFGFVHFEPLIQNAKQPSIEMIGVFWLCDRIIRFCDPVHK